MIIKSVVILCTSILLLAPVTATEKVHSGPELMKAVAPVYPLVAIAAGVSGSVVVQVQVDRQGNVTSTRTIDGPKLLRTAAEHTARRWLFSATDEPATREARLVFSFKLVPKDTAVDELSPIFMPPYQVEVKGKPVELIHRIDP